MLWKSSFNSFQHLSDFLVEVREFYGLVRDRKSNELERMREVSHGYIRTEMQSDL